MRRARGVVGDQLSFGSNEGVWTGVFEIDVSGRHGEVFTRRWVVELILDLAGYTPDRDLGAMVVVEPSCGVGAFLVPMVERLVESCHRHSRRLTDIESSVRAFDLLAANVELAQKAVVDVLTGAGSDFEQASATASRWVRQGDFLLTDHQPGSADFVVGNPPYIRLEDVPAGRSAAYRQACPTMRGRSDIFVGFIERGLGLLADDGVLGFIVADRWMHNQYGSALRRHITSGYAVEAVVTMHDVEAFEEPVSAYPAVTVIRRAAQSTAVLATANAGFGEDDAGSLVSWVRSRRRRLTSPTINAAKLPRWFDSDASWPAGDPANLALVADLEQRFETLESSATGTRIGIGVASGMDDVYLTSDATVVEPDRLLPLLMTRDTVDGRAAWSGTYLVNPWSDGRLVDLDRFPRLRRYLRSHDVSIKRRHIARSNPQRWFRTIDRVEPGLLERRKLVIPELKAYMQPVLDEGKTYPHHGLYFITSDVWDLEVLGGLLLSDIAELFVSTYCVKMRGGCYRFQAQYLRRIRVPDHSAIVAPDRQALRDAFATRDRDAASRIARRLYGVDEHYALGR